MSPRPRAGFVLSRMGSARLVLSAAALTIATCSALTATAATFAATALPQATHTLLTQADAAVAVQGELTSAQAVADGRAIHAVMSRAFGPVPVRYLSARWSDPLGLPGAADGPTRLAEAAAFDQIRSRAVLAAGAWPGPPAPGRPVPAAATAAVAQRLRLSVGDVLRLRDTDTGAAVTLRLTGIVRPRDPRSPYWRLDVIGAGGAASRGGFVTYGPLIVDPSAFGPGRITSGQASWVAEPALGRATAAGLGPLAGRVGRAVSLLEQSQSLHGLSVATRIPALLNGAASDLVVARSMMAVIVAELLLLTGAALALAARLLASQREDETALLSARGGSRWQLLRLSAAETALLSAGAAAAGAALAAPLEGLLARSGPLGPAGLRTPAGPSAASWWAAAAVFALCAAVLLWPAIRPPAGLSRARRGRPAAMAGAVAAGGDVALVVLALLAGWQLRGYSAVAPRAGGGLGVDPVLTVAPALALAGGALVTLRLLPALARACDGLAARGRRLDLALPGWQLSRRPARQAGPVLLVTLTVAAATLALVQHQSWLRSVQDQAAFQAGADVRLDTAAPASLAQAGAIAAAPGVRAAVPVARIGTGDGEVLALDAGQAADTVLLRSGAAGRPAAALWRALRPAGPTPGVRLPGPARRLAVTASLRPAGLGPAPVSFTVQDNAGDTFSAPAGTLPADGQPHLLTAQLSAGRPGIGPLRLVAITVQYADPRPGPLRQAAFTVTALAASASGSGPFPAPFARGGALAGWTAAASAPPPRAVWRAAPPAFHGWRPAAGGGLSASFFPGFFQVRGGAPPPVYGLLTLAVKAPGQIPAIATRSYLAAIHRRPGEVVQLALGAASFQVKVVAAVPAFPTVTSGGGLIVDQRALQDVLASAGSAPEPVSEWWLRTSGAGPPSGLPAGAVTDRAAVEGRLMSDPLSGGPQQALLGLVLAAAVLALAGLAVSLAATLRQRRATSALLAALGVSRLAQARQFCLEQSALSGPAALAGVALGAALARLLVRAVTLTATAATPVPPALVEFPWARITALAVAVALAPVVLAAVTVVRRPDPAAQLRAAEAT